MMKMATEIARRVAEEREKQQDGQSTVRRRQSKAEELVRERERTSVVLDAPPAYVG
jgi:hypothetical protein